MPSRALITIIFMLTLFSSQAGSANTGVNGSKHDLSLTIGDPLGRVCVFCHVPHGATTLAMTDTPLWSRPFTAQTYTTYQSSTMKLGYALFQPSGASRLCLSCHDGTIALGSYAGRTGSTYMPGTPGTSGSKNLGTDLSDDHPISFSYADSQSNNAELDSSPSGVSLPNGQVQCTSCHDPHNNEFGNFLVMSNTPGAPLCVTCHKNTGWANYNGSGTSTHSTYLPNACLNCHSTHNAPKPVRLLNQALEENVCFLSCHDGSVSPKGSQYPNVKTLFGTTYYRHPVEYSSTAHDEVETFPVSQPHVECVDCHNPHRVNDSNSPLGFTPAPNIDGRLLGVKGVNTSSSPLTAQYEYEICFRCHGGANASNFIGLSYTHNEPAKYVRTTPGDNLITRFTGVSYHPVALSAAASGSLNSGISTTTYCSDCHNNDSAPGSRGPHGSTIPHILVANYKMTEPRSDGDYVVSYYALCYRCHDSTFIMSGSSGFSNSGTSEHYQHVVTRGIRCFTCHDPHGVPGTGGDLTKAHLVNIITTDPTGSPGNSYLVAGYPAPYSRGLTDHSGSCTVSCHSGGTTGPGGTTHNYTK